MMSASAGAIRHEWFQSDASVVVSVFIKKADPADVSVDFDESSFTLTHKNERGSETQFTVPETFDAIDAAASSFRVFGTKIDVTLVKAKPGLRWAALEAAELQEVKPTYPSSSKKPKDWSALAKSADEPECEPQGEAALNQLFQSIYKDADEDTRRAMMKSFVESNGTCLSTNWQDVGSRRVEVKPPQGMEAKPFEQ